jgi:hypothetical protein
MNVFATLKTVFFGSKFLSTPVPSDGTPRRDLVSALNGLMPLCRTIPGVHLAVDIREGRVALVLDWTPMGMRWRALTIILCPMKTE